MRNTLRLLLLFPALLVLGFWTAVFFKAPALEVFTPDSLWLAKLFTAAVGVAAFFIACDNDSDEGTEEAAFIAIWSFVIVEVLTVAQLVYGSNGYVEYVRISDVLLAILSVMTAVSLTRYVFSAEKPAGVRA